MAKKHPAPTQQKRKPRLLWANPFCLLDTSSGASMSVRQMLHQLVASGYEVQVLGATVFDNPKGMGQLNEQYPDLAPHLHQLVEAEDGPLTHQLVVTFSTNRKHMTAHEEGLWYSQYTYLLDSFKPDVVWYYGGQTLDLLIADEARARGVATAFYLANGNYKAIRWCRDVDLILTDSQATADMYRKSAGFAATPVGKFIDPSAFIADQHERKRLLFVNPSWPKGASVVVQLAVRLEAMRPDIVLEVVEARADWSAVLRDTTRQMGEQRESLANVHVTPNTSDMRGPYSRARILLAPSLWWESSGRVLAEAMLNGIPALITRRGGMPEMIDDAGFAFDFPDACYEQPYQHLLSDEELAPLLDTVIALYDDESLYQEYVERAYRVGDRHHHIDRATERLLGAFAPLVRGRTGNKDFRIAQAKRHRHKLTLAGARSAPEFKVDGSYLEMIRSSRRASGKAPIRSSSTDFNWQLEGKVIVLDNRSKLIKSQSLDSLLETGAFGVVAFDPASEVSNPKRYEGSEDVQLFQHALLGDGQPATLNVCLAPELTSTLAPLPPEQLPEHRRQGAKVITKLPINTIALDSIQGLASLDWLILDELSDAIAVLENGKQALKDTLLIQARVAFQPTHEKQPSFAELQHWASRNGFRFYRFNDIYHYSHLPEDLSVASRPASEQENADLLLLPSDKRLAALSDEKKSKLAFVLASVFDAKDVAYKILKSFDIQASFRYLLAEGVVPDRYSGSGFEVRESGSPDLFKMVLSHVLKSEGEVRVVQVGANDGKINDPLYDILMCNIQKSKVALIEPQPEIMPHLRNNYANHPGARFFNCAIGKSGFLTLYRVKPGFYDLFVKRYLKDSPSYRVPSGFSSFDRDHVVRHVSGNVPGFYSVDEVVEPFEVPCCEIESILLELEWSDGFQVLQIDTEGMDDEVVYCASLEKYKPVLVNFEHAHLGRDRYFKVCRYLSSLGYSVYKYSPLDTLATLVDVEAV